MGSSQKIVNGVIWSTIVNVVNAIYGFISVPILINYFGKADYGLIGLAMSINVYLRLMDMGFSSTNLRFFSNWLAKGQTDKANKLFQSSLAFYGCVGLLNALILFVVSIYSENLFHLNASQDIILKNLIYILMISAFVGWLSSCFDQLIQATENVAWVRRRSLIPKILQIIVLFLTIYCHFSIVVYFLLTTFATFSILPLSINKIRKEAAFASFIPKINWPVLKETLPYCLNIFSFGIFQFSFYNLRPVFLGIQGTIESVTDYRILNGITAVVVMLGGAFMGALLPSSAKTVANDDKSAYYRIAYDGTKYISIVCSFCCFGMISVGTEMVTLYVGESYLYLIPWLNLLLLCTLTTHNQAISSLVFSNSDIRAITYNSAIASIVGLLLAWFLIPKYQIGGVVIAYVVYGLMQLVFYYIYYWPRKMKIDSVRVLTKSFLPATLLGAILGFALSLIHIGCVSNLVLFFIKGVSFTVLFSIGILLMLNNTDKEFFMRLIHKKN